MHGVEDACMVLRMQQGVEDVCRVYRGGEGCRGCVHGVEDVHMVLRTCTEHTRGDRGAEDACKV